MKINCIRLRIFALFSFPIQFSYVSSVSRICVEFVSQENLFHDRISSFVPRKKKKKKKKIRSFSIQTEYHLDFQSRWSESKFTSVGLIDRFGSPYQLRIRYREVFSRYATVAANFRESKRIENCSSLFLPLATSQRHCGTPCFCPQRVCLPHEHIYIYLCSYPAPGLPVVPRVEIESRKRNVHIQLFIIATRRFGSARL